MDSWDLLAPICTWRNSGPENLSPWFWNFGKEIEIKWKGIVNAYNQKRRHPNINNGYFRVGVVASLQPMNGQR